MIERDLTNNIKEALDGFPVLSITGPRQSGKTTLIKNCFKDFEYINLEDPAIRKLAESSPTNYVKSFENNVIFDEAQYVPDIFSAIQVVVDDSNRKKKFILSGSQNFLLLKNITQSLAGRVCLFKLFPLSFNELYKHDNNITIIDAILKGGYPGLYNTKIKRNVFFNNYLETYVQRDVAGYFDVRNTRDFKKLIILLASRAGQLINYSDLSKNIGVDARTIKEWISILISSYICFEVPPYFKNIKKRIVRSSKIYFYDSGLLSYLLNVNSQNEYQQSFVKGQLFENFVMAETMKFTENSTKNFQIYFYRDSNQQEADLLIDNGRKVKIYEIKSGDLVKHQAIDRVCKISQTLSINKEDTQIIYPGDKTYKDNDINIISVKEWFLNELI